MNKIDIKKYWLASVYMLVMTWLLTGAFYEKSNVVAQIIGFHIFGFVLGYSLLLKTFNYKNIHGGLDRYSAEIYCNKTWFFSLAALALATMIFVYVGLGEFPLFEAMQKGDQWDSIFIRSQIYNQSYLIPYANNMLIFGVLPVLLCAAYILYPNRWYLLLNFSLIYAVGFMQKSMPLFVVFALLSFAILKKKYRDSTKIILSAVFAMLLVHVVLAGYINLNNIRTNFISAAHAASRLSDSNKLWDVKWVVLSLVEKMRFVDTRADFKNEDQILLNGRKLFYSTPDIVDGFGLSNFIIKLKLTGENDVGDGQSYVLYIGSNQTPAGSLSLVKNCVLSRCKFGFNIVDSANMNSYMIESDFINNKHSDVEFGIKDGFQYLNVNGKSKGLKHILQYDLRPPVGQNRIFLGFPGYVDINNIRPLGLLDYVSIYIAGSEVYYIDYKTISANLLEFSKSAALEATKPVDFFKSHFFSLLDRIVFMPGRAGVIWSTIFPSKQYFLNGCGYKIIATIMGCDFVNTPVLVHKIHDHELEENGITGTINAAEVFNSYANFGYAGSLISGFMLGLFFAFVFIFLSNSLISFCVVFPHILFLSTVAFTTQLFSGGLLLSLVLLPILFRRAP